MRSILLIFGISLIFTASLYSKERAYPLISSDTGESFLIAELGSAPGITLRSQSMNLSLQYYTIYLNSIAITTDLILLKYPLGSVNLAAGLGGGITFSAEVGDFNSYLLLRAPLYLEYKSFLFTLTPMVKSTMFEYETLLSPYISANVGYLFPL